MHTKCIKQCPAYSRYSVNGAVTSFLLVGFCSPWNLHKCMQVEFSSWLWGLSIAWQFAGILLKPTDHRSDRYQDYTNATCCSWERRTLCSHHTHTHTHTHILPVLREVPLNTHTEEVGISATLTVQLRPWWGPTSVPQGMTNTHKSHNALYSQGRNNLVYLQFPYVVRDFSNIWFKFHLKYIKTI